LRRVVERSAWCTVGLLLLLALWGAYTAIAGNIRHNPKFEQRPALVTLSISKPDPQWKTWITGTRSQTVGTYDDGGYSWSVYVRYRGCPVTPRGAFRVTVYSNAYKWNSVGQGSWVPDFSQPAVRYSRTAIAYKPSDSVLYTWPAHLESSWEIHIEVPSRKGCASWQYGSETN